MKSNENIKLMGTTDRHSNLVDGFAGELRPLRKKGDLEYYSNTMALVYDEDRQLIEVDGLSKVEENQLVRGLSKMQTIEPDLLVFQHNAYLTNFSGTRKAGCPDLVIEVWSEYNKPEHRADKFGIYSSSPATEHWYLEQKCDILECYLGKKRLPDQHLRNILKTQSGLEFDLTDLQTFDDEQWNEFIKYGFK